MKWQTIGLAMGLGMALMLSGCGGPTTVGTPAGAEVAATPLSAILDAPEQYEGRVVVLRGVLTGQCAALCDFTYTEGRQSVTIFMGKDKPPKIKVGQPVRVTATVHQGEQQLVLTAQGLELLPRKGTP